MAMLKKIFTGWRRQTPLDSKPEVSSEPQPDSDKQDVQPANQHSNLGSDVVEDRVVGSDGSAAISESGTAPRAIAEHALSDTRFSEMQLHPLVQRGLSDANFVQCTPIQAETLPIALAGKDVAGQAQTGTGKTAAFLLVIFNHLLKLRDSGQTVPETSASKATQLASIVLAPTRELAVQIHRDAILLGKHTGLRIGLAYGGVDYKKQRQDIVDGMDILIGTPGRIIDYLKQGVFTLKKVQVVVLDEADRMFDLGFIKDIRFLLRRCPPANQRQSMLFSATLSLRVTELAYEHMDSPQKIVVESDQVTAENIDEKVLYPSNEHKLPLLVQFLRQSDDQRAIVFVNTRHVAKRVANTLRANGIPVALLSGNVPQDRRQKLLDRFHKGDLDVLVATDVAARGLHIPEVSHVINYDLPQSAEDYVHRIGRTARLGASGHAISFACEHYAFHMPEIEEYIGYRLPEADYSPDELPKLKRPAPSGNHKGHKKYTSKRRPQRRRPKGHSGSGQGGHGGGSS